MIGRTGESHRAVRIAEIVVVALTTLQFVPVLLLYTLDALTGTFGPDTSWALALAIGLTGLWVAVLAPESLYFRRPAVRWTVLAALAVAVIALVQMIWGSYRAGGFSPLSAVITGLGIVVALHHGLLLAARHNALLPG